MAATDDRSTESGIDLKPVYSAADAPRELEAPGEFPYTTLFRSIVHGRPRYMSWYGPRVNGNSPGDSSSRGASPTE